MHWRVRRPRQSFAIGFMWLLLCSAYFVPLPFRTRKNIVIAFNWKCVFWAAKENVLHCAQQTATKVVKWLSVAIMSTVVWMHAHARRLNFHIGPMIRVNCRKHFSRATEMQPICLQQLLVSMPVKFVPKLRRTASFNQQMRSISFGLVATLSLDWCFHQFVDFLVQFSAAKLLPAHGKRHTDIFDTAKT